MSGLDLDALLSDTPTVPAATAGEYGSLPWVPDLLACTACPCRAEAKRVVPGEGPLEARIGFLGRNPGGDEDEIGQPFVGRAGAELSDWMVRLGLDRSKVLVTNLVKCATTDDRAPRHEEIRMCAGRWLAREVLDFPRLEILFTLGDHASRFVLGVHSPGMSKLLFAPMRVELTDRPGRVLTVIPLAHPSYLLRKPSVRPGMLTLLARVDVFLRTHAPGARALSC